MSSEARAEERKKENQNYLKGHCDQIMRRLVLDILKARPNDVLEYMAEWVGRERGVDPSHVAREVKGETKAAVESEESDEEDHEAIEKLNKKKAKNKENKQGRSGVSAEVYGKYNKKEEFVPKVIAKSEEAKKRIYEKLNKNFMFKSLEPENKEIVINAMEEKRFK